MKLKVKQEIETEVDVEFPIYARHDLDGDGWSHTIFIRRDQDGTSYSVKSDGDVMEIEIRRYALDGSDYTLGLGQYKSSAAEFAKALNKARLFLARVPEPERDAHQPGECRDT